MKEKIWFLFLDCILENIQPPIRRILTNLFNSKQQHLDYNDYVGRIVIGRIVNGKIKSQSQVTVATADGTEERGKITKLFGLTI
jgi:GTP-binding protein